MDSIEEITAAGAEAISFADLSEADRNRIRLFLKDCRTIDGNLPLTVDDDGHIVPVH